MGQTANPLKVSVIVPVFNDEQSLESCLTALTHQTYASSQYEVIVVDNGSTELGKVEAIVKAHPPVKLVQELTPGSYAARNQGISVAQGEILAFTDADCIPSSTWLEQGVQTLIANPQCGLVGGQIKMLLSNPDAPTMVELYESVRALPQQEFVDKDHFAATANLFTTREVIERVGQFNSDLKSSGDVEWGRRVYASNLSLVYCHEAVVLHPTHSSFDEFSTRTRRLAGGHYDLCMRQAKSGWQQQIGIFRLIVSNAIPPVFFAIHTLLNPQIVGIGKKLKISLVMVMVRYISLIETLRLRFGKASIRT